MLNRISEILADFDISPGTGLRSLRTLQEQHELEFAQAAFQAILIKAPCAGTDELTRMVIHSDGDLLPRLLNPDVSLEHACRGLIALCRVDPGADIRLVKAAIRAAYADQAIELDRTLAILERIETASRLVPLMMQLYRIAPPRAKARLTTIMARGHRNVQWVDQRMLDPDPRVRANVVEAYIGDKSPIAINVFKRGLADCAPRVVANSALGLYFAGSANALKFLGMELAAAPTANERASACWAMGQSRDQRFRHILRSLIAEPHSMTKRQAFHGLVLLKRGSELQQESQPEHTTQINAMELYRGSQGNVHYRVEVLRQSTVDSRPIVTNIKPIELHIYQGNQGVLDYQVRQREARSVNGSYDVFFRVPDPDADLPVAFQFRPHIETWKSNNLNGATWRLNATNNEAWKSITTGSQPFAFDSGQQNNFMADEMPPPGQALLHEERTIISR
ncbi:hypothetical protein F183_A00040 [Bryobacterales bacterium F-183]|nr:hypothetical protein F183_A00040 [Bryobacterales bacterium F-183]